MNLTSSVGKYIIVRDLFLSDYMKDEQGNLCLYDTLEHARDVCGIYEFPDTYILKIEEHLIIED